MDLPVWAHWIAWGFAGIVNAIAIFKGISHYAKKSNAMQNEHFKEAILAHREDASRTEARFILIEQKQEKLSADHTDTRNQLGEIKDMLGEIREAMFSMLKKP